MVGTVNASLAVDLVSTQNLSALQTNNCIQKPRIHVGISASAFRVGKNNHCAIVSLTAN